MDGVLSGVRVLEVATWTFVPAAGAVLAEWGADVIKVEHPVGGDPQRGLISSGLVPAGAGGVNYMVEVPNRGKRSVAIDISTEGGREVLLKLAATSDVFLTNYLPQVREKLRIDVDDIRAVNPDIIYVRGSGHGTRGPDAQKPGYDGVSYWARGGVGQALTPPGSPWPIAQRPAFGDVMGGMALAGGVAAALFRRQRGGGPALVDVSLLSLALWNLGPDVTAAKLYEGSPTPTFTHETSPNPLVGSYRTKDDRFVTIMMLQADKFWPDFCQHAGLTHLVDDERFKDALARFTNGSEFIKLLDDHFAQRTLEEWKQALAPMAGAWAAVQNTYELHDDPDVKANGYLPDVTASNGAHFAVPANPVQFDETPPRPNGAPEHGQHTEELLLEVGLSWEDIAFHKQQNHIL